MLAGRRPALPPPANRPAPPAARPRRDPLRRDVPLRRHIGARGAWGLHAACLHPLWAPAALQLSGRRRQAQLSPTRVVSAPPPPLRPAPAPAAPESPPSSGKQNSRPSACFFRLASAVAAAHHRHESGAHGPYLHAWCSRCCSSNPAPPPSIWAPNSNPRRHGVQRLPPGRHHRARSELRGVKLPLGQDR
jgi:hypothetical protein